MDKNSFEKIIKEEFVNIANEYNCSYQVDNLNVSFIPCNTNINNVKFFYSNPINLCNNTCNDKKSSSNEIIVQILKFDYEFIIENAIIKCLIKLINNNFGLYPIESIFSKNSSYKISLVNSTIEEYLNDILFGSVSLIHELSTSKYESSNCYGALCYFDDNTDKFNSVEILDDGILFSKDNKKMVRKLLVATMCESADFINKNDIFLNLVKRTDDNSNNALYVKSYIKFNNIDLESISNNWIVKFTGFGQWKLFYLKTEKQNKKIKVKQIPIIEYNNEKYYEYQSILNAEKEMKKRITDFLNTLQIDEVKNINNFSTLICKIKEYGRGAIIILTDDKDYIECSSNSNKGILALSNKAGALFYRKNASDDEKKFYKQGIDDIVPLCGIDGAVFFNEKGELKSFGTILEGNAHTKGERSRGSRYNSTKTFIGSKIQENEGSSNKKNYLAIVISEDGPTNIFTTDDKLCCE